MNRVEMIAEMDSILNEMEPMILKVNVKLIIVEGSEKLDINFIREGLKWLQNIHKSVYEKLMTVRALLTPEMWKRYEVWDCFENHRESIMLKEALAEFRKEIVSRNKPNFWKRSKVNEQIKKLEKKSLKKQCKK